jgi:hypothetical protein
MSEQLKGQMTIFDFNYLETPEAPKVDFSCFSSWRVGKFGIGLGNCKMPKGTKCRDCEAYYQFYKKADEYHKSGEPWNISLALAREFLGIPCVPEYSVEHYRKFRTKGGTNDG